MAWISREEAVRRLGVKPQSLYAYVSRGRVGVRPDPADPRRSQYDADDVAVLAAGRTRSRAPRQVAAAAIAWGEPVLPTTLSTSAHGRLFYRGKDAAALAEWMTPEQSAALLWNVPEEPCVQGADAPDRPGIRAALRYLAGRATTDPPCLSRNPASLAKEAWTLFHGVGVRLGAVPSAKGLAEGLASAWNTASPDPIRRAAVLLADHELNPSTFACRVAASTGASLAACLLAGMATLSGPLHGQASAALTHLVDEAARVGAVAAVCAWLGRGFPLPGFGHPLYADMDPRAAALLRVVEVPPLLADLADAGTAATGHRPNIDFALVAAARAHGWPPAAPLLLFAAARTSGWLAHAQEQAASGRPIRPRARYEGPPLEQAL